MTICFEWSVYREGSQFQCSTGLLYMDSVTASMKRLAYAKVCVEVSIDSSIPQFVDVILRNGLSMSIGVDVPWMPPKCSKCFVFGHSDKTCYVEPIGSGKTVAVDHGGIRGSCNQYVVLTDVTEAVVVASTVASVGDVTGSDAVGVGLNPSASTAVDFASIDVADIAPDVVDNQIVVNEFVGGEREVVASSLVDIQVVVGGTNVLVEDPILSLRNAFHGVAQLLQEMKVKKKGQVEKGRKKAPSSASVVKSKRQAITSLLNEAGAPLDTQELISNEIVNFFSSLLGAKDPNVHCPPVSLLKDLISFNLPASEADLLTRDLTDEEIKQAIFGQDNDKSPWPDGYSAWWSWKVSYDVRCFACQILEYWVIIG
ncbi:hypothetical protein V6N13_000747 [Hibiscus sabdariffa]